MPLLAVLVAESVVRGLGYALASAGVVVNGQTGGILLVLVFGAGTDYCLFLVSRYRAGLADHQDRRTALSTTSHLIAPVVVASGATVVLGFLSQLTARFGFYRSMGPAIAIAIAVTVAAAITLTPAILALLGSRAFWPAKPDTLVAMPAARLLRWQRLAGTVAVAAVELGLAQLDDMGLVIASRIAEHLAEVGGGLIRDPSEAWWEVRKGVPKELLGPA